MSSASVPEKCNKCGHIGFKPNVDRPRLVCTDGHNTDDGDTCAFHIAPGIDHRARNLELAKEARKAIESMTLAGFKGMAGPDVFDEAQIVLADIDQLIEFLE